MGEKSSSEHPAELTDQDLEFSGGSDSDYTFYRRYNDSFSPAVTESDNFAEKAISDEIDGTITASHEG